MNIGVACKIPLLFFGIKLNWKAAVNQRSALKLIARNSKAQMYQNSNENRTHVEIQALKSPEKVINYRSSNRNRTSACAMR